ncbi:CALMODULIN-BINDING PROTEIN-RELATED [Salix koriyanagi]|uniref:CALMODULIN-BINDING PROTEIN-RELATED n=1 Tax=Salix koriyanagi TaxID=2511006 RepID=A0A9Q0PUS9_9ROSI|nr:CALMODULIN-BINDING PROTEIN-RELATED [Salix koriyanagi]
MKQQLNKTATITFLRARQMNHRNQRLILRKILAKSNAAEMDVAVGFVIEDEKDGDTDCSSSFSEKESNRSDIERESHSSMEEDDNISEATSMDWEEGQTLTSDIDAEADDLNKQEDKFWTKVEFTAEIEKLDWREDSEIIMSDDAVSNYTEEIPSDEVLRELFAEETASSDMQCSDRDSESDIIPHYRAGEKIQENNETDKSLGDGENGCAAHISAEALKGHQEDKSLQAESAATKPQTNNQELAVAEIPDSEAGDATEAQEQIVNAELPFEIHVSDSPESFSVADQDDAELNADGNHMTAEVCQLNAAHEKDSSSQDLVDDSTPTKPHDHQLDEQDETNNVIENENLFEEDQDEAKKIKILTAIDFEAPSSPRTHEINSARDDTGDVEETEVEVCNESDAAESFLSANNGGSGQSEERKPIKDYLEEEEREFNPREPNFLPVVPNPEAEKVDLRHQMMDGRKNSEEWMLDYALRQDVTKLAPARKRKVALLVEAFENVLPTPKYETHIRHTPATFSPTTNSIL